MLVIPGRVQPDSQSGVGEGLGMRKQSHETQSVCFCVSGSCTHKCGLRHQAYGSVLANKQIKIADLTFNYPTYTHTYV